MYRILIPVTFHRYVQHGWVTRHVLQESVVTIMFPIHTCTKFNGHVICCSRPKHRCDMWNPFCDVRHELHLPIISCFASVFCASDLFYSLTRFKPTSIRTRRSVMLSLIFETFSLLPRLRHQLLFRSFNFHVVVFPLIAKRIPRHWLRGYFSVPASFNPCKPVQSRSPLSPWLDQPSDLAPASCPFMEVRSARFSPNAGKRTSLMNRFRHLNALPEGTSLAPLMGVGAKIKWCCCCSCNGCTTPSVAEQFQSYWRLTVLVSLHSRHLPLCSVLFAFPQAVRHQKKLPSTFVSWWNDNHCEATHTHASS